MAKKNELSPWVSRGLYSLAVLLVVWPMVDLITNLWPIQVSNFRWRYGFAGLLGGFHLTPLFGFVLAMMFALWRGHAGTLRFMGYVGILACVVLGIIMIMFPLDTLQIRAERDPGVLPAVVAGAVIAEAKHFTTFLVLVMLSRGCLATAKTLRAGTAPTSSGAGRSAPTGSVVVGKDRPRAPKGS